MIQPTCEFLKKCKQAGKPCKYLRQDDSGENKALGKEVNSKGWQLGITIEYTGAGTPQRNHLVELGFASVSNKGRALLTDTNVPKEMKYKLARLAMGCATDLGNL